MLGAKRRRTNRPNTPGPYEGAFILYHAYEKSGEHNGAHFRQLRVDLRHPFANALTLILNDSRLGIYPYKVSIEELRCCMRAWDEAMSEKHIDVIALRALVTEPEHHSECARPLPKMAKYPAVYLLACVDLIRADEAKYPTPMLRARLFSAAQACHPKAIYNFFYTNLDVAVMNAVLTTISEAKRSGPIEGGFAEHLRVFLGSSSMDCEDCEEQKDVKIDEFELLHQARNDLCGTTSNKLKACAISRIVELSDLRLQAIKMFEEYAKHVSGPQPEWHHTNRHNGSFTDPELLMTEAVIIDKVDHGNLIIQPPNNHEWVKVDEAGEVVDDYSDGNLVARAIKSSTRSKEYVHPELDKDGTATIRQAGPLSGRRDALRKAEVYFDAVVDALVCI